MTLTFPTDRFAYDFDTGTVRFMATEGIADMIVCGVSEEALAGLDGGAAFGEALIPAFVKHRARIEAAAQMKFERGQREPNGLVLVTAADLAG